MLENSFFRSGWGPDSPGCGGWEKKTMGAADTQYCAAVRGALLHWYGRNRRDLPWRRDKNPYRIWVSEVMLQQTRVETAIGYYRRFIDRFPDIATLAAADLQEVLKLWEGLGYYSRARNLHKSACRLAAENNGALPDEWGGLKSLPGVGDYIAAAVLSIAYGRPYPAVDANAARVFARLLEIAAPVNRAGSRKTFREAAAALLDADAPGDFNQAVMELGALVCKPRQPECRCCPLSRWCFARMHESVAEYPVREKSRPVPSFQMVIGVVIKDDRLLIVQRPYEKMLGGLWEFPGGARRPGESAVSACLRHIRDSAGLAVTVETRLKRIRHAYTHFKMVADVFLCRAGTGRVRRNGPIAHRWVGISALQKYPFPGSHHKFIPALIEAYDALPGDFE
ncbi:MAG TPA: A/G-specific adenine glycosylase [Desulfosalsimonadaceae bacterium]|nr:A/G-specific adenine glycosylase [Desulfosalsimonadaceae bacterium]